jgi:lambda family phage minor tail protein L
MLVFIPFISEDASGTLITSSIQTLEPSGIIELFEVDASSFGGGIYRFHGGTNELLQDVVWKGEAYSAFPIEATGFEYTANGQLPRPKVTVSNVSAIITFLVLNYDDLIGAKFIRRRTLIKYLDAVNFPGGVNPDADPDAEFAEDIYFIDRKTTETKSIVEFELAAAFDLAGIQLPRRQIIQNVCVWKYRGTECAWAGTTYYDANDNVVGSAAYDVCGKRLSSCQIRFGENQPISFGSFPSVALIR